MGEEPRHVLSLQHLVFCTDGVILFKGLEGESEMLSAELQNGWLQC